MFEGPSYPSALDESVFEEWLAKGRMSITPFAYMLVIWDELDRTYMPVYVEQRSELQTFARYGEAPDHRLLVAAYDLYSETRVV
jgi:hypothetical protein